MTTSILTLSDVHVVHTARTGKLFRPDKVRAVDGVSLTLHPGETLGIVGESGCGKSTLARVIVGLQPPTSGTVTYADQTSGTRGRAARLARGRALSMVFQDPSTALNARMSVHDILRDPLDIHGVGTHTQREHRIVELLDLVGLPRSAAEVLPSHISGGQRQRVAIARALALGPDLIVADEPTSALDVSVRAQILNLLTDLKQQLQLAMVFISHDIQTVRYVSDRIAVMNSGQIVEQGIAQDVFDHPSNDYTRKLLNAAPALLQ